MLQFGDHAFDAELVAFDKDGTLIDFEFRWGRLAIAWVEHLTAQTGDQELQRELYHSLGYDQVQQRTKAESPLAIASTDQLRTIAAGTLYRHGTSWAESEHLTRQAFEISSELPLVDMIRPTGDVEGLLERLKDSGVRVAVVTTDHRAETVETLRIMGIAHLADQTICGDDGLPNKPAPDMLQAACRQLGVELSRTAVVGDTMGDLFMAEQAGAGFKAAVLTGAGEPAQLRKHADVVLRSIDEIAIRPRT